MRTWPRSSITRIGVNARLAQMREVLADSFFCRIRSSTSRWAAERRNDPELLLVLPSRRSRPPTVWDVHEDTAAALTTKARLSVFLCPVAVELVGPPTPRRAHIEPNLGVRRV